MRRRITTMKNWRPLAGALLAVALCLAVAACGSSDGSSTAESSSSTTEGSNDPYAGLSGSFVFWGEGNSAPNQEALDETVLANFGEETGMSVKSDTYCCGIEKLAGTVKASQVPWTVGMLASVTEFEQAKKESLLEEVDPSIVPLDRVEGAGYGNFGVPGTTYSANIVWNTDDFPSGSKQPTTIEDVFDTKNFPGKRCMSKYPQYGGTMEAAALAAGADPESLYPLDVEAAFDELDKIKDEIVWWETGGQALQNMENGTCSIGIMWNGTAMPAVQNTGAPLAIAWGHAITVASVLTIPKNSPNVEAAQAFLRFWLTDSSGWDEYLSKVPYPITVKGLTIPPETQPWAAAGANLKDTIAEDDDWYSENIGELSTEFTQWLTAG
jgi:putative spermidine/putrescine transport system substrate-binding protein